MARQTNKEKIESTVARLLGNSSEPDFGTIETQGQLSAALNWYHIHKESKDAVKYLNDYAKKNKIVGKLNTDKNILTTAWLCRLLIRNIGVPDNVIEHIKKDLAHLFTVEKTVKTVATQTAPTPTIQDRIAEKVSEIVGDLEGSIDDYILSKFKVAPAPLAIMQDRVKLVHASKIIDIFKKKRTEFDEVLHTKDEQLIEGYSNFSKTEIKKLVSYCDTIITDANKISESSKVNRKPRKRKVKSPAEQVSKIQICAEDKTFNIKSEPPVNIIGASSIWVFNIKTKKLGVYHALDSEGFGVKGTSLTNFSEMKSVQKTLRKPLDVLPNIVKGGKVYLRNVLDELTTKDSPLNGRLNADTVLVKIIK